MNQLALIQNDDIPQVEATKYIPTEVAFVKPFEQQLATIEGEFSKFVFDYADKEQNEAARSLIAKLRKSKAAIEKAGKAERDPAIQYQRHVIAEEDKLVVRVQKLIDQYDKPLKEWEATEQLRKERIQGIIRTIRPEAEYVLTATAKELRLMLGNVEAINPDEGFDEFSSEAFATRIVTLEYLKEHIAIAEKREADAAELEALRAAAEARRKADEEAAAKAAAELAEKERAEREAKEAAARAEAEAKRKADEEARIAREREQAADAERKRVEAEAATRELVLKEQAAKAERERIESEAAAKKAAEEAEARRVREVAEAEAAAKKAAVEAEERQKAAVEAERKRQADEQAAKDAEEARKSADRAHRGKIHGAIVKAMMELPAPCGVSEVQAKAIVIAICGDQIPELKIIY